MACGVKPWVGTSERTAACRSSTSEPQVLEPSADTEASADAGAQKERERRYTGRRETARRNMVDGDRVAVPDIEGGDEEEKAYCGRGVG